MAPWGVHPFHRIRYLRLGPDPLVQRDLSTKLPSMDGGAVLAETFGSAPTFGGAISQVSSFGGACSTLTSSVAALPTSELEHDTFSFSTLDTPSAGCQPSPDETLSVTPHRTTISYPSYWRLARALDRLNAPIPKHPNTILGEGSNDVELPKTGKRSRRSADIQKPAPKRVKLPPSVASSSANERSHTVSLPLSNPGGGIDTHKPELPLRGVVAFVDAISRDGDDLSEHWGEILRKLGARVTKTISQDCTHVVFYRGRKATVNEFKRDENRPLVVGLEWVHESRNQNRRIDEGKYLVDLLSISEEELNKRRSRRKLPNAPTLESYDDSL